MRILQVSSAVDFGGGETHLVGLTETLRRRGHDVVIAGRSASVLSPDVCFPFLNSADIFTAVRLRRFIRTKRFTIVHGHIARDYPIIAASALGLADVRIVLTRHLLRPVRANPLYRRVDGWIAPTRQIQDTLAAIHPKRSVVIPNWVDPNKFQFRPKEAAVSPFRVGLLGQIAPHKGHDDALEAMKLLGGGFKLLIAGKGDTGYVEALREKGRDLDIEFYGFMSPRDFFEKVDILIVPSWEEPFGLVVLEGMACGVPVIATAAGGPLTIVRPDRDGLLVPPRNPRALADALRSLAVNSSLRHELVRSARKRVETEFEIEKTVVRIEAFYEALVGTAL